MLEILIPAFVLIIWTASNTLIKSLTGKMESDNIALVVIGAGIVPMTLSIFMTPHLDIAETTLFLGVTSGVFLSLTIIEMKGWKAMETTGNDYFVNADGKKEVNPLYQVMNYEGKIRYGVENADNFSIDSIVILYNINNQNRYSEKLYFRNNERCLIDKLRKNLEPGFNEKSASLFLNGKYVQNKNLFDAVKLYFSDIKTVQ